MMCCDPLEVYRGLNCWYLRNKILKMSQKTKTHKQDKAKQCSGLVNMKHNRISLLSPHFVFFLTLSAKWKTGASISIDAQYHPH